MIIGKELLKSSCHLDEQTPQKEEMENFPIACRTVEELKGLFGEVNGIAG
jgi:hypothetical protein